MEQHKLTLTTRTIHFYELEIIQKKDEITFYGTIQEYINNNIKEAIKLNKNNRKERFCSGYGGKICLIDLEYLSNQPIIAGILLRIRMDVFPELMDTSNNEIKDIEAKDSEGVIEKTHFLLDYSSSRKHPILAIEYNQYGSKSQDFYKYLQHIDNYRTNDKGYKLKGMNILKDTLDVYQKRIGRCASFTAKVFNVNIRNLNKIDSGLQDAFNVSHQYGNSKYVKIFLKFDYKKQAKNSLIRQKIEKIINAFKKDESNIKCFDELEVKAEDNENDKLLEVFDLIAERIKSKVEVQKSKRNRSIISSDMFSQLLKELKKHFGNS
ncbi:MAG: hypothetical protein ACPG5B_11380 [Chitinophagales bacterium]